MSGELVHANVNDLDRLDPQSREVAVTSMLSEARQWLAHAVEATEPKRISEFKAFMATVAETTKQLNLSKEIQLDALEMVRRGERGVGKAIRQGQSEGTVNDNSRSAAIRHGILDKNSVPPSPMEFVAGDQERADIYAMTDDVSDEEFEAVLDAAKEEKNVSRANVVRKLRSNSTSAIDRWNEIREAAEQGWTSEQLARKYGYSRADSFRNAASRHGIEFPADKSVSRSRRIDPNRVMRETTNAIYSQIGNFELVDYDELNPDEAHEWVDSLTQSIKALSKARNQIKESLQ